MGMGLSGFAQGFAQGFNQTGQTLMAAEKAKRENELKDMQIAELKKDQAYKAEIGELYKNIATAGQGGAVGGEAIDETGASLGTMQFANPAEAKQSLQSQGLKFKEGTTLDKPGKSSLELEKEFADGLKIIGAKYGKIDLDTLKKARDFDKELHAEGAMEAMKYALSNPSDQEGIKDIFNKKGRFKIGDDVTVGIKQGPFGPSVYGYRTGKDGKQEEVFDGFNDIILPSLGPKAWATAQTEFKKTGVEQQGATFREAMKISSAEKIAAMKGADGEDKPMKRLENLVKSRYEALAKSFESNGEINRWKAIEGELGAVAAQYVNQGHTPLEAINKAQGLVFEKYKVDTSSLIGNTKK